MKAVSAKSGARGAEGFKLSISERDKKLLLVFLIAAIIGLPYYFVIQPSIEKLNDTRAEITRLQNEKLRLEEHVRMIPTYNAAIEEYVADIAGVLAHYPRELPQEAALIFIDKTEREALVRLQSVSFTPEKYEQITAGGPVPKASAAAVTYVDPLFEDYETLGQRHTGESTINFGGGGDEAEATPGYTNVGDVLSGVVMEMSFSYSVAYEEYKAFLAYVLNNQERHVITRMNMSYNAEDNIVSGNFALSSYAIYGFNRYPVSVAAPRFELGTANIFLESMGLHSQLQDFTADLFVQLRNADADADAVMLGLFYDPADASYLVSNVNGEHDIIITLLGSGGRYMASYSLNGVAYAGEPIMLNKNTNINLDIFSAARVGSNDNVTAVINVINQTDIHVNVTVYDEDTANPRVTLETEGDVRVTNLE